MTSPAAVEAPDLNGTVGDVLEDIQAGDFGTPDRYGKLLLGFDIGQAADLQLPSDGQEHSGRSVSPATWNGHPLGELAVTALAPGQRTVADPTEELRYQIHMPIATLVSWPSGIAVHRLLNHLAIINADGSTAGTVSMHVVGESEASFRDIIRRRKDPLHAPDFPMTTGYRNRERFGEGSTVENRTDHMQIVGTISVGTDIGMTSYKPLVARSHRAKPA